MASFTLVTLSISSSTRHTWKDGARVREKCKGRSACASACSSEQHDSQPEPELATTAHGHAPRSGPSTAQALGTAWRQQGDTGCRWAHSVGCCKTRGVWSCRARAAQIPESSQRTGPGRGSRWATLQWSHCRHHRARYRLTRQGREWHRIVPLGLQGFSVSGHTAVTQGGTQTKLSYQGCTARALRVTASDASFASRTQGQQYHRAPGRR